MTIESNITDALVKLNWKYGQGDIAHIDFEREVFTTHLQYGTRVRTFRISYTVKQGLKLHAFGRKVSLT